MTFEGQQIQGVVKIAEKLAVSMILDHFDHIFSLFS